MLALITAKLCSQWSWPRQLTYFAEHNGPTCRKKYSLRAGFEPAREDPIGFQVQRLNHSAITAYIGVSEISTKLKVRQTGQMDRSKPNMR